MTTGFSPDHLEVLRRVPLFTDLPDEDLEGLASTASRITVPAGGTLFEENTRGDQFYVILTGEMEVTRREGGETVILAVLGPGGFLSEMSLLEDRPRSASARAIRDSDVMGIEPERFRNLVAGSPGAALTMLRTVTARLRSTESSLIEQGRLAGLGTLAAGLAHELNNPASAVQRSSSLLRKTLTRWGQRSAELLALPLESEVLSVLGMIQQAGFRRRDAPHPAEESNGPAQDTGRDGAETELEAWLEDLGVDEPWTLAPSLADAGWDRESLAPLGAVGESHRRTILFEWVATGAEAHDLGEEIQKGAEAIASIVRSVRSYSHLDRGPVQMVDLEKSISDTLTVLKGKVGERIEIILDFPPDLPEVEAFGGELNQAWTNLVDNALDAMGDTGTLEIRGSESEDGVILEIIDSGSGIPPETRPSIFDPFFTTKPQGAGTGLGLAITYGIIVNRHRGTLQVESEPGRTVFRVALPARQRLE